MAYPFIVLEGIDGCGKETQARELLKLLKRRRQPAVLHKYPTAGAKKVHEYLVQGKAMDGDSLFSAFVEDLQAHQAQLAKDRERAWVIADRYCVSTAAYQGVDGKLDARIAQLEKLDWVKPDFVLWLDVPVEEAMRRKAGQKKPDRHEADKAFLKEVRANFDALFRRSFICSNWKRIDASQPPERVAAEIREAIGQ
ncbi:MAG: dTMP kinase [Candidatus Marsarchaeota archaeon]|nr:dTMP kinase [Candidatus Marsarchaeota archaeon]